MNDDDAGNDTGNDTLNDSGPIDIEKLRRKIIRQRNLAVGFLLGLMVLLFFAITIVKLKH